MIDDDGMDWRGRVMAQKHAVGGYAKHHQGKHEGCSTQQSISFGESRVGNRLGKLINVERGLDQTRPGQHRGMVKNRASRCGNHSWTGQPSQGRGDDWTRYGNGGISGRHSVALARRHRGQEGREREWDGQSDESEWRKGALCKL